MTQPDDAALYSATGPAGLVLPVGRPIHMGGRTMKKLMLVALVVSAAALSMTGSARAASNPFTHKPYAVNGPLVFSPQAMSHAGGVYYADGVPSWVCDLTGVGVVAVGIAVAQPEVGALGGGVETAFCEWASTKFGQSLIYKYAGLPGPNCFWVTRRRRRLRYSEGTRGRYMKCIGQINV